MKELPDSEEDDEYWVDTASSTIGTFVDTLIYAEELDDEIQLEARSEEPNETLPEAQLQARPEEPEETQLEAQLEAQPEEIDNAPFETKPVIIMDHRAEVSTLVDDHIGYEHHALADMIVDYTPAALTAVDAGDFTN